MDENEALNDEGLESQEKTQDTLTRVTGMYKDWFLDYASYVILERAVPAIEDGFKPVQRRIMHSLKELDDGRYNKVANVVGHTMQYHPHGDASIADAMVTNFHLPKSSLVIMVAAFGGHELILEAYAEAVKEKYRFFSYGDAMLII